MEPRFNWYSHEWIVAANVTTFFAPVDDAFRRLHPRTVEWLYNATRNENVTLLRQIILSHVFRGESYLYQCAFTDLIKNFASITEYMQSDLPVTFTGTDNILTLTGPPGTPSAAHTMPPWVDIDLLDGILHKVDGLLIPPEVAMFVPFH